MHSCAGYSDSSGFGVKFSGKAIFARNSVVVGTFFITDSLDHNQFFEFKSICYYSKVNCSQSAKAVNGDAV